MGEIILIAAEPGDLHANEVARAAEEFGARIARVNTADLPQRMRVTARYGWGADAVSLRIGDAAVSLGEVGAVWLRRTPDPAPSPGMTPSDAEFAATQSRRAMHGLWLSLRDRFFINPFDSENAAGNKLYQLCLARRLGFDTPRSIVTNDPAEAAGFFAECAGREVVFKTLWPYPDEANAGMIFTTPVDPEDFAARRAEVALAPCLFQEYVPKDFELRITVVGREVFAARIESQRSEISRRDWRRYDLANTPYSPFHLPEAVSGRICELLAALGIFFGCVDIIVTPDGRFVFLEVNPSGQWLWVQQLTGLPIAAAIARALSAGARSVAERIGA